MKRSLIAVLIIVVSALLTGFTAGDLIQVQPDNTYDAKWIIGTLIGTTGTLVGAIVYLATRLLKAGPDMAEALAISTRAIEQNNDLMNGVSDELQKTTGKLSEIRNALKTAGVIG